VAAIGGQSFARKLKHLIEIPAGPGTRPGERLRAPNPSIHAPWPLGPDGSRSDFRVLLSRRGSNFGAVCLGPVSERGEPLETAQGAIQKYVQRGWRASGLDDVSVAGEAAWRTRLEFPRSVLMDWLFAREGWLFAAGVLCRSGDRESVMVERAEVVLATWQWIDPHAESAAPPALWSTRDSIPPPAS
jgi:hypothetical protein